MLENEIEDYETTWEIFQKPSSSTILHLNLTFLPLPKPLCWTLYEQYKPFIAEEKETTISLNDSEPLSKLITHHFELFKNKAAIAKAASIKKTELATKLTILDNEQCVAVATKTKQSPAKIKVSDAEQELLKNKIKTDMEAISEITVQSIKSIYDANLNIIKLMIKSVAALPAYSDMNKEMVSKLSDEEKVAVLYRETFKLVNDSKPLTSIINEYEEQLQTLIKNHEFQQELLNTIMAGKTKNEYENKLKILRTNQTKERKKLEIIIKPYENKIRDNNFKLKTLNLEIEEIFIKFWNKEQQATASTTISSSALSPLLEKENTTIPLTEVPSELKETSVLTQLWFKQPQAESSSSFKQDFCTAINNYDNQATSSSGKSEKLAVEDDWPTIFNSLQLTALEQLQEGTKPAHSNPSSPTNSQ